VTTTATRVPLCGIEELPPGLGRSFEIGDRLIAVFRGRNGNVFAVEGRCPHKGGPLADGMLVGEQVVCPLHAFRFDGMSGECEQSGVCPIETYPAEVHNGAVIVTVAAS
jgi:nitrite reductase [NAD(P)H] small subunit